MAGLQMLQMSVRKAIVIAACVCTPGSLMAQQYQYQTPGYVAPTPPGIAAPAPDGPGIPGIDMVDPMVPTPAPDPVPDVSFRDRLQRLYNGAPAVKIQPGYSTSDTTSSYSTSAAPDNANAGNTTGGTTSSYTTSVLPGSTTRNTTNSYSTVPDPPR